MNIGIILASGSGSRFKNETPKQFIKIAGMTVIEHTIKIFEKSKKIDEIIVVISPEYRFFLQELILKNNYSKIRNVLNGGETRKESSYIGISSIECKDANVIIHDAARPFLSEKIIDECVDALKKYDAIDVAIPSADTLVEINEKSEIKSIPNRSSIRRGQTPQCFKLSTILKAHELSKNDTDFTDDCGLVVKHNLCPVYVINGENNNIKITYPEDIFLADKIFQINSISSNKFNEIQNMNDKVIVIFGGNSGIGKSVCEMAKRYGAKAYSFSRSSGTDISNYSSIEKALKDVYQKHQKIDYVINTAGVLKIGKICDKTNEEIKQEIDINYTGSINVVKASIPYLEKTLGCILLFTSSSYTRGRAMYSIYSSTKAGIVNLTQALAEELYEKNIRINSINPERTATEMRLKSFGKEPEESLLKSETVAYACLQTLLSNYTGQVIDVRKEN